MFEINLVPDVKAQLLRAQRLRNFVMFISIVVAAGSAAVVMILAGVVVGQNIAREDKKAKITALDEKVDSFGSLSSLLTMQGQLADLDDLNNNRKVLSRVFNIVDFLRGDVSAGDSIDLKTMSVNLDENTITITGQAIALVEPEINYRVLEKFKKTFVEVQYDYGRYMRYDKDAQAYVVIPAVCIYEDYDEEDKRVYGYYMKGIEGCEGDEEMIESMKTLKVILPTLQLTREDVKSLFGDYAIYRDEPMDDDDIEKLDGEEKEYYFKHECVRYAKNGEDKDGNVVWAVNNDCYLAEGRNDMLIPEHKDGADESNNGKMVLKFTAMLTLDPEILSFKNKHLILMTPTRKNVTDSYLQIDDMLNGGVRLCDEGTGNCNAGGGK